MRQRSSAVVVLSIIILHLSLPKMVIFFFTTWMFHHHEGLDHRLFTDLVVVPCVECTGPAIGARVTVYIDQSYLRQRECDLIGQA